MNLVEKYGKTVWQNGWLESHRRTQCICLQCARMHPGEAHHCNLAQRFFDLCKQGGCAFLMSRCAFWIPLYESCMNVADWSEKLRKEGCGVTMDLCPEGWKVSIRDGDRIYGAVHKKSSTAFFQALQQWAKEPILLEEMDSTPSDTNTTPAEKE